MVRNLLRVLHGALPLICLAVTPVAAEVVAEVDRNAVELNESFELTISVDHNMDLEPDLTVLEQDFYVGRVEQRMSTVAVNGQFQRSRSWKVSLMARQTGELSIPPVKVGNESSAPVVIEVREPELVPPGQADVFITSEVERTDTYVHAQFLYRIKVYLAVQTRQATLRNPEFSGAEALVEVAGEDRSYEAVLDGRAYVVHERVFAVFPQQSGEIEISPARFEARILSNGRITGRKSFAASAHSVTVKPIPAAPPDYPDAAWLPALDLTLVDEWSRDPSRLQAGEPVTRVIAVSALGQLETQIPALEVPDVDGINQYTDKPELGRVAEADGIRGTRRDQYAVIGVADGPVEIPELVLPWWDLNQDAWRFARLPAREIAVHGAAAAAASLPAADPVEAAANSAAADEQPEPLSLLPEQSWKLLAQIFGLGWLLTLLVWWWSGRSRASEQTEPAAPPLHKQQANCIRAARKAALAGDTALLRTTLLEWARLEWPGDGPRSIGELADRVESPLAEQLQQLSAACYGSTGSDWDRDALAAAIRKIRPVAQDSKFAADVLPTLAP